LTRTLESVKIMWTTYPDREGILTTARVARGGRMNTRAIFPLCLSILLVQSLAGCAPAATPTPQPATPVPTLVKGTVERHQITSPALAANLIGNPDTRDYWVYLPPGYENGDRRYPVVYALHGWGSSWIHDGLPDIIDRDIHDGLLEDMIFVFPYAGSKTGGSWYLSSPTIGDYETYLTKDLVDRIDSTYRTLPDRESRGLMGCSMGGTGALHLGLRYPEVFSVAASMSSSTTGLEHDPIWQEAAKLYDHDPKGVDELMTYEINALVIVSMAAVAAPNPDKPPVYFDLPFTLVDGKAQIVPDVFAKINAKLDPLHDIDSYLGQPFRLRGLLIYDDTDISDLIPGESAYVPEASRFADRLLTEAGIEHEFIQQEGTHCGLPVDPVLEFLDAHLVH
jgi:pimeloyl-ACP methyl ester carboxylesterase